MVHEFVWRQQSNERLRQTSEVLRDIDQRDSEIARRAEHRYAQRADEDDVANGRLMALPEMDSPGKQTDN
jgi:hypothetical protein